MAAVFVAREDFHRSSERAVMRDGDGTQPSLPPVSTIPSKRRYPSEEYAVRE